jgi:hypothetical protein
MVRNGLRSGEFSIGVADVFILTVSKFVFAV